jgi:hypothetical protein
MIGAAALGAAALVFAASVLPPAARPLAAALWPPAFPVVSGVFHVHTVRSDGTGTVDHVAAAAARAGLHFVIFTDHGDGTRPPDPPAYRSGVLCLDGVEISTTGGHYAALGIGQAPYPLGGDPRDVVEDVARLGGFGVATHPDSAKTELAWRGWSAPFDALEWLNADSEWRTRPGARLAVALATYPFRPAETVASLFRRPSMLGRWDALRGGRRPVAVAGTDAHARVGWRNQGDPYEDKTLVALPSYEASFGAFSLRVVLPDGFSRRPREDAEALLRALRAGHVHTIVDGYARPGVFEFTGRVGAGERIVEGDTVALTDALVLRVRTNAPAGTRLVLFRDGKEVHRVTAQELLYATNHPGAYRAEAWLPGAGELPMPWAVSNAIEAVGQLPSPGAAGEGGMPAQPAAGQALATVDARTGWSVEREESSSGTATAGESATRLDFRLGPARRGAQYVALAHPVRLPAGSEAIVFDASASAPMRVSVQLRVPRGRDGERWERSVYLDGTPRQVLVRLDDMRPAGAVSSPSPRAAAVDSLLLVVDRVHASAGAAGSFSVSGVRVVGK